MDTSPVYFWTDISKLLKDGQRERESRKKLISLFQLIYSVHEVSDSGLSVNDELV